MGEVLITIALTCQYTSTSWARIPNQRLCTSDVAECYVKNKDPKLTEIDTAALIKCLRIAK
jgi:hypothetical protein